MKVLGYDVGRKRDPSALVMIEGEVHRPQRSIVACRRLPLGMRYFPQADLVGEVANQEPDPCDLMVMDGGGVGDAVAEMVRRSWPTIDVWTINSTGGEKVTLDRDEQTINIPKSAMVEHLGACLGHGKLKVKEMTNVVGHGVATVSLDDLSEVGALFDELIDFQRRGAKLEAAPGSHDDLVMATCLALMGFKITQLVEEMRNG